MSARQLQQVKKQQARAAQPTMIDNVPLNLRETNIFPITVDMLLEDGSKEPFRIRKAQQGVQLQLKLQLMRRAPKLFYDNDPHWQYVQNGEINLNV